MNYTFSSSLICWAFTPHRYIKAIILVLYTSIGSFAAYSQQDSVRTDSTLAQPIEESPTEETEPSEIVNEQNETVEEYTDDEQQVIENDTTEIGLRNRRVTITKEGGETKITIGKYERRDNERTYQSNRSRRHKRYYKESEVDFISLDLGFTNYREGSTFGSEATIEELELQAFRPLGQWALHFFPTRASLIGRGIVNLETAISLDFNNYSFVSDITLLQDQDELTIIRTGDDFDRNKLSALYAQIPLLINFRSRKRNNRGVSLSVGGYFGLLWRSRTVQRIDDDRIRVKDSFNLNNERYGVTARLSFKWFRVYFNVNLSPLFEDGEGPEVSTFSTGINVIQF